MTLVLYTPQRIGSKVRMITTMTTMTMIQYLVKVNSMIRGTMLK
jgi:hypothetical protein